MLKFPCIGLVAVFLFMSAPGLQAQITKKAAAQNVMTQVIDVSPTMADLVAYCYDAPGPISASAFIEDAFGNSTVAATTSWFFWIDHEPNAYFVHPCDFVLVDAMTGAVTVAPAEGPPNIDGVALYSSYLERTTSPDIFFGNPLSTSSAPASTVAGTPGTGSATNSWAILVTGPMGHEVADGDIEKMSTALTCGGVAPDLPMANIMTVDSKAAMLAALQSLGPPLLPCDKLYFHYTGHGDEDGLVFGDGEADDDSITYQELADAIANTGADDFCISIEACYSGSGVQTVCGTVPGDGVTSAGMNSPAYFDEEAEGSYFTCAFSDCLKSAAADLDANGSVSYTEAKTCAVNGGPKIITTQDPQCWEAECFLLAGLLPANVSVMAGDTLLVSPELIRPMTLVTVPTTHIPNIPALVGLHVYFQAALYNTAVFPNDPLKLSAGLDVQIGVGATLYGTGSGLGIFPVGNGVVMPGDSVVIGFSIPGF